MRWELTEEFFKKLEYKYDIRPDHRERIDFQRRCYNIHTGLPHGPIKEVIRDVVRVIFEGKEYVYTNRQKFGVLADLKSPWDCYIPEWEIWQEPIPDTIDVADEKNFNSRMTKTVGVKGWITHYLNEWTPDFMKEIEGMIDHSTQFKVKRHGILEPVILVPNKEIFLKHDFKYLFMRKYLQDPLYKDLADEVRYMDQLQSGITSNAPVGNAPPLVPPTTNTPPAPQNNTTTANEKSSTNTKDFF